MEGRMTLCNLSIEGGARFGIIAPDETTFVIYSGSAAFAPKAAAWEASLCGLVRVLSSDEDAHFDREALVDASEIAPTVTWGTSPEQALPITAAVPAAHEVTPAKREAVRDALEYMGLKAGHKLEGMAVDRVFIGSCTNGRIEDLREAAHVLRGRKAKIPGHVSPGSAKVKAQAEAEGLDQIFKAAGLDWVASGCSMCVGMNGDLVEKGQRCASSTNRNFKGRQGRGARTHLMSPAMVAAASVTGMLTDVRRLLERHQ